MSENLDGSDFERAKYSEWQDILGRFQRIDEMLVECEKLHILIQEPGGYKFLRRFVYEVQRAFRQFKYVCTEVERDTFDEMYEKALELVKKEENRALNKGIFDDMNVVVVSKDMLDNMTDLLDYVYEMNQVHGLGYRVFTQSRAKDRIKRALTGDLGGH